MSVRLERITADQATKVVSTEEGQFSDVKAIDIAPAKLTKTTRSGSGDGGGGGGGGGNDPWATGSSSAGGQQSAGNDPWAAPSGGSDEPPF